MLKKGLVISLISDAGTPSISDPGSIIINECISNSIDVTPLPGPSSVSTAISISGFSEKFFSMVFFLKNKKVNDDLKLLSSLNSSIIFFASAKKIKKIISLLKKILVEEKFLFVEK